MRGISLLRLDLIPQNLQAVIFDFDGVFTDNKVYVFEDGKEAVVCDRGDGLAIEIFRKEHPDIKLLVLSKEKNPVVQKRCEKLNLTFLQGIDDKYSSLKNWLQENDVETKLSLYLGNDINDIECMELVGCGVAVADAYPEVKKVAKVILTRNGGNGAIREILELISLRHGQ